MNGRKAKKLRRIAESMTQGLPKVDYEVKQVGYKIINYLDRMGKNRSVKRPCFSRTLSKNCTRYYYKQLKKGNI